MAEERHARAHATHATAPAPPVAQPRTPHTPPAAPQHDAPLPNFLFLFVWARARSARACAPTRHCLGCCTQGSLWTVFALSLPPPYRGRPPAGLGLRAFFFCKRSPGRYLYQGTAGPDHPYDFAFALAKKKKSVWVVLVSGSPVSSSSRVCVPRRTWWCGAAPPVLGGRVRVRGDAPQRDARAGRAARPRARSGAAAEGRARERRAEWTRAGRAPRWSPTR